VADGTPAATPADPPADEVDDPVAPWRALLRAQDAVVRSIEDDLARAGAVNLSWYDVLLELNGAPDRRLRMQDLAARTVLSRSRVSRLVDELVDRGLVERQPDPADGRASFAHLTAPGRDALRAAAPVYVDGIERHFTTHLDAHERAVLTTALQRVVDAHAEQRAGSRRR
jgi:DNA-binding MarR family transcriptional regulator